jgi:hypothetical protein
MRHGEEKPRLQQLLTMQLPNVALNGESSSLQAIIESLGGNVCCQDLVYFLFYCSSAFRSDRRVLEDRPDDAIISGMIVKTRVNTGSRK